MHDSEIKILLAGDLAAIGSAESLNGKPYNLIIETGLKNLFNDYDLSIVNLESPLTNSTDKIKKSGPHLKGHPESIALLNDLGVNVACLSNNHIRDFGDQGVIDTVKICNKNNIHTVGAGRNINDASHPLYLEVKGKKLAIMNFSEREFNMADNIHAGSNPDDPMHIWYTVQEAKKESDYQIVILHGGKEMYSVPTPYQLKLFRFIADIGVTAVIGHHSHVIGGFEYYKNTPLIYSLGNFIFDEDGNPPGWYKGALAGLKIKFDSNTDIEFHQVGLQKGKLSLIEARGISDDFPRYSFLKTINEEEVVNEWNKIINDQSERIIKVLLGSNPFMRLLLKFKIISLKKHERFLIPLLNRFRCQTHRDFSIDSINRFINSN
jgi:hypothetical protein